MCSIGALVSTLSTSPDRWLDEPLPAEPKRHLAGIGLGVGDQFGDRFGRHVRIHHQHVHVGHRQRDVREVPDRVVRQLRAVDVRIDGVAAGGREPDGVAVRRGLRDPVAADRGARAADVFDHHRLPEQLRELGRERAGETVGRAAGRERHDPAHGFRRISLRSAGAGKRKPAGRTAAISCMRLFRNRSKASSAPSTQVPNSSSTSSLSSSGARRSLAGPWWRTLISSSMKPGSS